MTGASLLPLHEIQGCKAGLRLHVEHQKMHFQRVFYTPYLRRRFDYSKRSSLRNSDRC